MTRRQAASTLAILPITQARLSVLQVKVRPDQVWFHCPRCQEALEGFMSDPRGQQGVVCDACGEDFDIPASAAIVIV